MPTWKKKNESGEVNFHHVCGDCNSRVAATLEKMGWNFLRDGEPVVCNECSLNCRLTSDCLWGEGDEIRYAICTACDEYARCALKGRYYC